MEVINLNLIPNGTNPVVHCSQYDEGREFRFNLFNGTSVLTLDGTETIECDVKKPDGNVVTVAVTNTSSDYIVVTTTLQMTACGGNSEGVIKISKSGVNLYTLNFILYCERNPMENGIQSDSAIHNLNTQIANAVADQYDSNNVIFDNAPTSGHGIGYAVTSEGIKTTIDNLTVGDLADVTVTTPLSGEALTWDGTKWVNGTVSTVGSIDDLSDVDTTGKGNDYSLVYNSNDAEWQAKKLTVEVTQAEYDQLKLDGDLVEGVHYVITDGQNVTCNLGDLTDVDTSGASTGDILVKGASGWEKSSVKDILTKIPVSATTNAQGSIDSNNIMTGGMSLSDYLIVGIIPTTSLHSVAIGNYNGRYVFEVFTYTDFNPVVSSSTSFDLYAIRLT